MNKIKFSLMAVLFGCAGVSGAIADDSVYVNLSVLDGLSNDSRVIAAPEPLFPIVKKAPTVAKPIAKKAQPAKIKAEVKKVEVKKTKAKNVVEKTAPAESKPVVAQIPFVQNAAPVEVVDVEPAKVEPKIESVKPKVSEPVVEPKTEDVSTPNAVPVPEVPAEPVVKSEPAAQPMVEAPKLLVEENVPATPSAAVSRNIVFAEGVDELSADQQKQIDEIIASFDNASNHKIAIFSYNLDDGEDVFKKKRMSLNRAVAVRSYLLPKGYKNFSIKVVNVDASSGKANTVELEELD